MDQDVSRAILLKAVLEFMHKEVGATQSELMKGAPNDVPAGEFFRANATPEKLRQGLPYWRRKIAAELAARIPKSLEDDPTFKLVYDFAVDGKVPGAEPLAPPDFPLQQWMQPNLRPLIIQEIGGTWLLFRKSARPGQANMSVLNIRPEGYYRQQNSPWTHFATWTKDDARQRPRRTDGLCMYHAGAVHCIGLRDSADSPLPTAMTIEHELGGHKSVARANAFKGLLFVTDSRGVQINASFDAAFVEGSQEWRDEDYRLRRDELVQRIGSHEYEKFADLYPRARFDALLAA